MSEQKNIGIGYSQKINDPAFAKYLKNTSRWSLYFSMILAVVAIVGFFIYGETSTDMDNPQATFIGLGISAMFIFIAIFQNTRRKGSKTWDGKVIDKKIKNKKRERHTDNDDYYWENYTEYTVFIKSESGKVHTIRVENDDTIYNYYKIGDSVRHHGELNTYEKYDKSRDSIIFCNACSSLCDINDNYCYRCKCPLLK